MDQKAYLIALLVSFGLVGSANAKVLVDKMEDKAIESLISEISSLIKKGVRKGIFRAATTN